MATRDLIIDRMFRELDYLGDLDIDGKIIMEVDIVECESINLILIAHCKEPSCERDNECPCYSKVKDLIIYRATASSDLLLSMKKKN
jgi:hypothetical protein